MKYDFKSYLRFIRKLKRLDYEFISFNSPVRNKSVILRHDVDWSPDHALKMAEMESMEDIKTTYFFLITSPLYNIFSERVRGIIAEIEDMGHTVGLHFSTHQYFEIEPSDTELVKMVTREIEILMRITSDIPNVVSFHMPPNYILNKNFDVFINTYSSDFFSEINYRADSSQRWRSDDPFLKPMPDLIQYLIHPGLWGQSDEQFHDRLGSVQTDHFNQVSTFLEKQYLHSDARGAFSDFKKTKLNSYRIFDGNG